MNSNGVVSVGTRISATLVADAQWRLRYSFTRVVDRNPIHFPGLALRTTEMHRPGVVALVIGGFGLAVLAIVVSSLREAAAMKRWPVAEGRVLSAKVEKYRESVSRGTGGARDRMTLYRPVLLYEYEVAGKRFRGSRIAQSPGLDRGVPEFAEKVVDRYPGGSTVAVRYNPRRPDESVLEPRVPGSWIFGAAIGVALLGLAVYTYYRGR